MRKYISYILTYMLHKYFSMWDVSIIRNNHIDKIGMSLFGDYPQAKKNCNWLHHLLKNLRCEI